MSLLTMGVSIIENLREVNGHISGHNDCFDHRELREVKDMSLATKIARITENRER